MKLKSGDLRQAVRQLEAAAKNPEPCPKCGNLCYDGKVTDPEIRNDLEEFGYDGTCCHPILGILAKSD